jgi:hypothetical protein
VLSNGARVRRRRVIGDERLARGLRHHLQGEAGGPEALEELVRLFVRGRMLPSELALSLPLDVAIREDAELGLFWFDNDDPDLAICAHPVEDVPLVLDGDGEAYVCAIDAPQGASDEVVRRAWEMAEALAAQVGGVVVDRYGFRAGGPGDLM